MLDKTTIFAYDNGGNITSRVEYKYSLAETSNLENGYTYNYEYASQGWRDQLLSYNGAICGEYDNLGNPRLYRGKRLNWSHGRQLDSIGDITYKYNSNGVRIEKTANGVTTKFYLDGTAILAQEVGNRLMLFTRGVDGLNGFTLDGAEYFYKKNIQGDIIAIMGSTGAEIVRYVYDAWGNHKTYVLANGEYKQMSEAQNSAYAEVAQLNPYRYRGYYYDVETGLYYLNSRYYDSEVGRFINADNVSEAEPNDINGLNLYAYCLDNPVYNVDHTGQKAKWWQILLCAVFVVVSVVCAVVTGGATVGATIASSAMLGAAVAGTISMTSQLATTGEIDPGQFIFDAGLGALSSGLLVASPGPITSIFVVGAGTGFVSNLVGQLSSGATSIDFRSAIGSAILGGGMVRFNLGINDLFKSNGLLNLLNSSFLNDKGAIGGFLAKIGRKVIDLAVDLMSSIAEFFINLIYGRSDS